MGYEILKVNGRDHVVRTINRSSHKHSNPSYNNSTGVALSGVLRSNQSLHQWELSKKNRIQILKSKGLWGY